MKPKTTRPLQRKTVKQDHQHQLPEQAMVMREHAKGTLPKKQTGFREGQKVALLISTRTEMGYVAIVNGTHKGILYKNEVFQPLKIGQEIDGFIKKIRDDQKLDLSLQKSGYKTTDILSKKIMDKLQQDGFIAVTDKSRPKVIADLFGVSKKTFKKSIGNLYKKRLITLEKDGIRLQDKQTNPATTMKTKTSQTRTSKRR
jgi:predicted RNA-binding protein (virulence factor B family)